MAPDDAAPTDRGMSLVEIVVTIALLGVAGTAVLGAMAGAARASSVSRSQAAALVWQQSGADYLATSPFLTCTTGQESLVDAGYQQQLQGATSPASPLGWAKSNVTVVAPVLYWNGTTFSNSCVPTAQLEQITLQVVDPLHPFTSQLVVVKSK